MIIEHVEAALAQAKYEIIEDEEQYYGKMAVLRAEVFNLSGKRLFNPGSVMEMQRSTISGQQRTRS